MTPHIRLLLVEDERLLAEDLRLRIGRMGFEVIGSTTNGEEAIRLAETLTPDLVIMDIHLDGRMDGIQAAEVIYTQFDIPVVFLTAYSDPHTLEASKQAGAFAYLVKPFHDDAFRGAVLTALYKHQSERHIRQSKEAYRILVEEAGQPIAQFDAEGRILFANRATSVLVGLPPESLYGRKCRDFLPPEEADRFEALLRQALESGSVTDESEWHINGRSIWIDLVLHPLRDRPEVILVGRDVTERHVIQRALEESERRYERLFFGMPIGMYQCTPEGHFIQANPALSRLLGYSEPSEWIRRSCKDWHLDPKEHRRFMRMIRKDGVVNGFEVAWKRRDGSPVWVSETARAVRDGKGCLLYIEGVVEDITHRKQAEEEIRRRLAFETFMSQAAGRFVAEEHLNRVFRRSFGELGRLMGADRLYWLRFAPKSLRVAEVVGWHRRGIPFHGSRFIGHDFAHFSYWAPLLAKGEIVLITGEEDIPASAGAERAFFQRHRTCSLCFLPVLVNGNCEGLVVIDNAPPTLEYRTVDVAFLKLFSEVLGGVIERRHMVAALKESEKRFRDIFENSAIGIGLATVDGTLIEVNPALTRLLQKDTPAELVGHSVFFLFPFKKTQRGCLLRGETVRIEYLFMPPPYPHECMERTEPRHFDLIMTPLFTGGRRRPNRFLVQLQDITERKKAEEALIQERDLLHALMDHIPDMIYFKDRQSRFTRINRAEAWLLGVDDPEAAVGKTDFDFFPKEIAAMTFRDEQTLMAEKRPQIGKIEHLTTRTVQGLWASATKVPLSDRTGRVTGMVGITRDITDLKAVQERLERTAQALARSNEELQHFAYVASHDLQEPLRMIASYLGLLKRRYQGRLDAEADEFIAYAVDGADRMQRLIQDLLQYSRVETRGRPFEPIDLNETLRVVFLHLSLAIEEAAAQVQVEALPTVWGDPGQIIQLFQNLLSNALKFKGKEPPRIRVWAEVASDGWILHVQDNGIGIAPEFHDQIFKLFRRLHSRDEYPGTGIGLAICKKIVERHGGRIWVDSRPGEGATFSFTLPKREEKTT